MQGRKDRSNQPNERNRRRSIWHQRMWWRGRRWYDPNTAKLIWSAVCLSFFSAGIRLVVYALAVQPTPLAGKAVPAFGIAGTAHDLSSAGLGHATQSAEVCIFCHTPHGSPAAMSQDVPIWNHTTTTAAFSMYTSASMKGSTEPRPVGPSLACLSCHDGTLAVGSLHEGPIGGGNTDYAQAQGGINPATGRIQGASMMGTDLRGSHPISVTYRDDLNRNLRPASDLKGVKLYPRNASGGRVERTSCHDPHNFGMMGSTTPFLRVTKHGSALCLQCHAL